MLASRAQSQAVLRRRATQITSKALSASEWTETILDATKLIDTLGPPPDYHCHLSGTTPPRPPRHTAGGRGVSGEENT